jgi:hypothetical protein
MDQNDKIVLNFLYIFVASSQILYCYFF